MHVVRRAPALAQRVLCRCHRLWGQSASHHARCSCCTHSSQLLRASSSSSMMHERINADGSLTTGRQRAREWQRQQQQQAPRQPGAHSSRHKQQQHHHQQQQLQQQEHVQQQQQQQPHVQRAPGVPAAAPAAPPISAAQLEQLADLVTSARNVVVLTGAGCSTESNIPDYRGPAGAYTTGFTPMTHQQFMAKPENRRRYFARSFAGWHEFATVGANAAHEGLARLQQRGWCGMLITQNVDRLHHRAGSDAARVLELHGTTHRVVCMQCGASSCRHELQQRLAALNPGLAERVAALSTAAAAAPDSGGGSGSSGIRSRGAWERALQAGTAGDARKVASREAAEKVPLRRPDGDVELVDAGLGFRLAPCTNCGAELLKPDVTFFGDSVPKERVDRALAAAQGCDLMLVVGSSCMVWSAYRLVKAAVQAGARLAIINVGPTRADDLAHVKVEALAGEVMMRLAHHPRLLLPRV